MKNRRGRKQATELLFTDLTNVLNSRNWIKGNRSRNTGQETSSGIVDNPNCFGETGASKKFPITGGAGFVGSSITRRLIQNTDHHVLVVDKLTCAGNLESLQPVSTNPRFTFARADIGRPRQDEGCDVAFLPGCDHELSRRKPFRSFDRFSR
jgi:NAD dependent epimerase/dehydratase family